MHNTDMDDSWDPKKAETNFRKHGGRFCDAEAALFDPLALTLKDQDRDGEQRLVTLGSDAIGRIIATVYA